MQLLLISVLLAMFGNSKGNRLLFDKKFNL
jgi:hypothetical protein